MPERALPPGITLRSARPGDLPTVLDLLAARKLASNSVEEQFGPRFAVAIDGKGELVGVAGVEIYGSDGLFRSAAVRFEQEGQGIGDALTRNRIAWAREHGLRALYLLTETAADYWPRFGFIRIARDAAPDPVRASPEWAGGCPASAVAMRLPLSGAAPG